MKSYVPVLIPLLLTALAPPADAGRWDVEESRTIDEVLSFGGAPADRLLVVDNVNGSISVTGHDGGEVVVVARELVRARSAEHLARARAEAGLVIDVHGSTIALVVDGPFRRDDGSIHWQRDLGYDLHYDFEIRLPRRVSLDLKTVNGGDVTVRGVEAATLDVANVNGAIELEDVAGHGRVATVNGSIDATYVESPAGACAFKTVNGNVDVAFPRNFAADLGFKTFNGAVYTDFDYAPRAIEKPAPRKRGRRTVWKSLGYGARIGGGGPQMSFETLNGNIYVRNSEL